jgi:hypothetical protein
VWFIGFIVGLDLGFGHGGEPQIVVGWVIAICDLQLGYGTWV